MKNFIEKNSAYIFIAMILVSFMTQCRNNKNTNRIAEQNEKNRQETLNYIDSVRYVDKIEREIENIKLSKNILYDWNSVVRTKTRPDDQLNSYDKQIEEKLNKLNGK